jgi:hypothetical protein
MPGEAERGSLSIFRMARRDYTTVHKELRAATFNALITSLENYGSMKA